MKIYFEDGRLDNPPFCDYHVNAAEGVRANIFKLDAIKEKEPNSVIYTNSIFAFDNTYAWDNELNRPEIYIRDSSGEFKNITEFTSRQLRVRFLSYELEAYLVMSAELGDYYGIY